MSLLHSGKAKGGNCRVFQGVQFISLNTTYWYLSCERVLKKKIEQKHALHVVMTSPYVPALLWWQSYMSVFKVPDLTESWLDSGLTHRNYSSVTCKSPWDDLNSIIPAMTVPYTKNIIHNICPTEHDDFTSTCVNSSLLLHWIVHGAFTALMILH